MFSPFAHDASASQRWQQADDGLSHRRDSVRALIAAAGYYQNLARPADLAFSEPRFNAKPRISGGWQ